MHRIVCSRTGAAGLSAAALLLLAGCGDSGTNGDISAPYARVAEDSIAAEDVMLGEADSATIQLRYTCNNKFLITNMAHRPIQVSYGTQKTSYKTVTLPAGPGGDPGFSETFIDVPNTSHEKVEVIRDGKVVAKRRNMGDACAMPAAARYIAGATGGAAAGQWSTSIPWPVVAIDMTLLPDGRVLTWDRTADAPQIWDPATGAFTGAPSASNLFCSSHTFLSDGRLLVAGGHLMDQKGLPNANIFDPATATFTPTARMQYARWYPTTIELPNGDAVTMAGTDENARNVIYPELWSNGAWRTLTRGGASLPYYPRIFVGPNSQVFYAGETPGSRYFNPAGIGLWGPTFATRTVANRSYGSAVMYQPGKVIYIGGGAPTPSTETIDLTTAAPSWQPAAPMAYPRRQMNATLLADGTVLATGGSFGAGFSDESRPVYAAELWNPTTNSWTTLGNASVKRVYHSTVVLLPDATVLTAGSGGGSATTNQYSAEIFTPPYLFNTDGTPATRPTVSSTPASLTYGQTFTVATPGADSIVSVSWIRLGSTTHAFNTTQNFQSLPFTVVTDTVAGVIGRSLRVQMTSLQWSAPPGPYMLFLLNRQGTPSVAKIIALR